VSCEQDPAPDNSSNDEYDGPSIEITGAEDIAKIGKTSAYPLNGVYTLTADIAVSDWTPIGTSAKPFKGTFDGGGKTITINSTKGGLFAFTSGATIKNLIVAGAITVTGASGTGVQVGGIAGNTELTTIENCASSVNIDATGHAHNSSAGGIAGFMKNYSTISTCTASGNVTLQTGESIGLMVYAGGIAGYSGTGLAGAGASGCFVTQSSYSGGTVSAQGGYPYAGGIVGYNYTGAGISECYSSGTVTATGSNLPYSGGIAGYNSGYVQNTAIISVIENCYSTAEVTAESQSKSALAGGIAGANAKGAVISKCYATGAVTSKVTGTSEAGNGGTLGPMLAASGGGIAGAQYYQENNILPVIEKCAALNTALTGADATSGAAWNIYRIAGAGDGGYDVGVWRNNIANNSMTVTNAGTPADKTANGKDGADTTTATPAQTVYQTTLGWDFTTVWKWVSNYPALRRQP
jgi:hypothetical protein